MVGEEVEPDYWFAEESFQETYTDKIWWPHLLDRAGTVGATYGVNPMAFAVHAEYINRPATIVVDPDGEIRFAYYGTYWGDCPSMEETLEMIRSEQFDFEHPERREPETEQTARWQVAAVHAGPRQFSCRRRSWREGVLVQHRRVFGCSFLDRVVRLSPVTEVRGESSVL